MTALEARTLATNLMRALLAVPGSSRSVSLLGATGFAFVEALGAGVRIVVHAANDQHPAPRLLSSVDFYAAHGFHFYASEFGEVTPEHIAALGDEPGYRVLAEGRTVFDRALGADLAP